MIDKPTIQPNHTPQTIRGSDIYVDASKSSYPLWESRLTRSRTDKRKQTPARTFIMLATKGCTASSSRIVAVRKKIVPKAMLLYRRNLRFSCRMICFKLFSCRMRVSNFSSQARERKNSPSMQPSPLLNQEQAEELQIYRQFPTIESKHKSHANLVGTGSANSSAISAKISVPAKVFIIS